MAIKAVKVRYKDNKLTVSSMKTILKKLEDAEDTLQFESPDVKLQVDFDYPEGSPYEDSTHLIDKGTKNLGKSTGAAALNTPYRYKLTLFDGSLRSGQIVIDPEVVFDDSPPRPKAATKKRARKVARKSARTSGRKAARGGRKKK